MDDMLRLGPAWLNTSAKGTKYIKGSLNNNVDILLFKNEKKQRESDPDYNVFLSERPKRDLKKEATKSF